MFTVTKSPFGGKSKSKIPAGTQIVAVSDMFVDDYVGGAELTFEALIKSSPFSVAKLHSSDVTIDLLKDNQQAHWIFCNFASMDMRLIPTICANMDYSIIECDYKYCKHRSPEKHKAIDGVDCDCAEGMMGKLVSAFMHAAKSLWWMSEAQQQHYEKLFPFLAEKHANTVLSSVFDDETLARIKMLREHYKDTKREGWIVLGSSSWVKGFQEAEEWCKKNEKKYEIIWNKPYVKVLEMLAQAEGFVYLPAGMDTCPRMVIEAQLLGCKLELNDNVQHAKEDWFATDDLLTTESYLYAARKVFWTGIKNVMDYRPTLSGYTTTRNCVSQEYPFIECIESLLGFCDEVVVVDGGSDDGTWEKLEAWASRQPRLKIKQIVRDWNAKRFALFDGMQKAEARKLCTHEFCWQQDSDEVVHKSDYTKVRDMLDAFPRDCDMIALPVVEYWGSKDKVRMDVTPWKWRLSRNVPGITHGVPADHRAYDESGDMYSLGSDGCDVIYEQSGERVPFVTFYTPDVDQVRHAALNGDVDAFKQYSEWFGAVVNGVPSVQHYSWIDIKRKMHTYRDYWQRHWNSISNKQLDDTAENNMFFNKPWSEVSEAEIEAMAKRLATEMGGWIFHHRVDFSRPTPYLALKIGLPEVMKDWMKTHESH